MFFSSETVSVDAKGRLAIPTKFRDSIMEVCSGRLAVTAHPEQKCLLIYPEELWAEKLTQINSFKNRNKKAGKIQRIFAGYSNTVEMDPDNGRVSLITTQRDYAGITKQVILVGLMDHFELWDEEHWKAYMGQDVESDEEEPEEIANFSF